MGPLVEEFRLSLKSELCERLIVVERIGLRRVLRAMLLLSLLMFVWTGGSSAVVIFEDISLGYVFR